MPLPSLAIHGGAGTISRERMTDERYAAYRQAMVESLQKGYAILCDGGSAMDAVEASVCVLEDSPLFNAGRGSVLTAEGKVEMDAAVMEGTTLRAGAVAGIAGTRHPVSVARRILQTGRHIMLSGTGAHQFAVDQGFEIKDDDWFITDARRRQLQRAIKRGRIILDHSGESEEDKKFGTVGAAAADKNGRLAAATSTGGLTNKQFGRIGDSPIIGAGTFADDSTCAVSMTGHGEYFMRAVSAYDFSRMMAYLERPLNQAARKVLEKIEKMGGEGGLVAVDSDGSIAVPFNSKGMYRAWVTPSRARFGVFEKEEEITV